MKRMRKDTFYRDLANRTSPEAEVCINAINLSVATIEYMRKCIKCGALVPNEAVYAIEKIYKDVESVRKGDVILPQMYYLVYPEKPPDPSSN